MKHYHHTIMGGIEQPKEGEKHNMLMEGRRTKKSHHMLALINKAEEMFLSPLVSYKRHAHNTFNRLKTTKKNDI